MLPRRRPTYLYHQIKDFEWLSHTGGGRHPADIERLTELVGSFDDIDWKKRRVPIDETYSMRGRMDNAIRREAVVGEVFSRYRRRSERERGGRPRHLLQLALYMTCEEEQGNYPRREVPRRRQQRGVVTVADSRTVEGAESIMTEAIYHHPNVKTSAASAEWKELIGCKLPSARNSVCAGYPLCLKKMAQIDEPTRKRYQGMTDAEKASVYHYSEREAGEPLTSDPWI